MRSEDERQSPDLPRKRDWYFVAAVWVTVTALGELLVLRNSFMPGRYSEEATVIDDAFRFLLVLAIPVFAMVVAILLAAVVRFRVRGEPGEDGPPLRATRGVYTAWFGITTALCIYLVINPGISGLAEVRGDNSADVVVTVTGRRWFWTVEYPDAQVTVTDEMVLPADARVRFDVTSGDVVHSFWVPAFRMKIDAVPGRMTRAFVTLDREGDPNMDRNLRLQCTELCGLNHTTMVMPVRVVPHAAFTRWLDAHRGATPAVPTTTTPSNSEGI